MNVPSDDPGRRDDPRVAYFDGLAPAWDRTGPDPVWVRERLVALASRLGFRPGQDLLEAGCGTGQITGWLVETVRPGRVVAIDFAPAMLAQARTRGVEADFRCLDICVPGPGVGTFDVVFCFHAFPHFRDPVVALGQMARHLRPAGELLVVHLVGSEALNARHARIGGAVGADRLPGLAEWGRLLEAAGLVLAEGVDQEDLFLVRARPGGG